jgi:hypothetical protein
MSINSQKSPAILARAGTWERLLVVWVCYLSGLSQRPLPSSLPCLDIFSVVLESTPGVVYLRLLCAFHAVTIADFSATVGITQESTCSSLRRNFDIYSYLAPRASGTPFTRPQWSR